MGRGGCVRAVDCRYCGYDAVMPYLKIKPDTYHLKKTQMFDFTTCQFCGKDAGADFQRYLSDVGRTRKIEWKRTCKECRGTQAVILKPKYNR